MTLKEEIKEVFYDEDDEYKISEINIEKINSDGPNSAKDQKFNQKTPSKQAYKSKQPNKHESSASGKSAQKLQKKTHH